MSRSKGRMSQPVIFRSPCPMVFPARAQEELTGQGLYSRKCCYVSASSHAPDAPDVMASCSKFPQALVRQNPALWTRRYKTEPRHRDRGASLLSGPPTGINTPVGGGTEGRVPRETSAVVQWEQIGTDAGDGEFSFSRHLCPMISNLLGMKIVGFHLIRRFCTSTRQLIVELNFSTLGTERRHQKQAFLSLSGIACLPRLIVPRFLPAVQIYSDAWKLFISKSLIGLCAPTSGPASALLHIEVIQAINSEPKKQLPVITMHLPQPLPPYKPEASRSQSDSLTHPTHGTDPTSPRKCPLSQQAPSIDFVV